MTDIGFMLPERSGSVALPDLAGYHDSRPPETDRILHVILREWRTFLVCLLAVVAVGVIYLVVTPRYYTSSAVVMAAPRQPDLSRTDSVLNGTTTPEPVIVRDPDIEGEIQIMSAPAALQRIVTDLKLNSSSDDESSGHASMFELIQEFRVLVGLERPDPLHPTTIEGLCHDILVEIGLGGPGGPGPSGDTAQQIDLAADILARNLKVAPIGRSTMVKIDFTSRDPESAARVANAIADNYIQARNQIRVDAASQASDWLRSHTAELRIELVDAEARLAKFRAGAQIEGRDALQLEGDMKILGDRIVAAKADQVRAASRLAVAEDRARRDGPIGLLSWDVPVGANEYLAQARAIADMHKEASKLSAVAGPFNGNVARIEAEAKTLEANLNREAQTHLVNLRMTSDAALKEVISLEAAIQKKRADYDHLEAADVQLSALQQAAIAARTVYQNFVTRWKTTEQTGFNEATGWLVSPASVPIRPSWPSIPMVLLASAVAGIGVGLSGTLWREYRGRRTLRSGEDVERLLPGIRSLGLIPEITSNCRSVRDVVAATGTGSDPEFEESVDNVWTSLSLAIGSKQPPGRGRVVLISSALPQEGKSAATGIIACAASAAGQRVVVVDCDLRIPTMSNALAVATSPGLVDYLDGTMDYRAVLVANPLKRVSVLPAGRMRKTPQQMLRSARLPALLSNLRSEFDLVLIDSPPVLGLADARLLAELADHTVLVAAWSRTTWKVVSLALQILMRTRVAVAGVILTRANMSRVARFDFAEAEPFRGKYRDYYQGYYNQHGDANASQPRIKGAA